MSTQSTSTPILTGGCLCGAVRYRISGEPVWAGNCHCSLCRRSSGAPYMSWLAVPTTTFSLTQGEVVLYGSSDRAERGRCPACGTQLLFKPKARPESTGVTISSLDQPGAVRPTEHIFWDDRIPGLIGMDDLPKRAKRT